MKNKSSIVLNSIKTNNEIVEVLKSSKKLNLPYITIWLSRQNNKHEIQYALLVNKSQFKLAVLRNKVKRQLRNILINSEFKGGIKLLFRPNSTIINKQFSDISNKIYQTIDKYQNGK